LRRDRSEFDGTSLEWLDSPADSLAFRLGGGLVCVLNAGVKAIPLPLGEVLLASGELTDGALPPDTAAWLA
jgi:alpha-glucosidase